MLHYNVVNANMCCVRFRANVVELRECVYNIKLCFENNFIPANYRFFSSYMLMGVAYILRINRRYNASHTTPPKKLYSLYTYLCINHCSKKGRIFSYHISTQKERKNKGKRQHSSKNIG